MQTSPALVSDLLVTDLTALSDEIAQLDFQELYIFGDSLSDPGNLFGLSGGAFPPPPYFQGRTSNGPVWSEYFATGLGLSPGLILDAASDPLAASQGINFAIAGSSSDDTNTLNNNPLSPPGTPPLPGLSTQLRAYEAFVGAIGPSATDNPLHVVWIGSNDYLGNGQTNPQVPLGNLENALDTLYATGARNFLVPNLPNLGETPLGQSLAPAALNVLTAAHNQGLAALVNQFEQVYEDAEVVLFDVNAVFAAVQQNPSDFGFTTTGGCFTLAELVSDPPDPLALQTCGETSLFWDELHPTTQAHSIIAEQALAAVATGFVPALPSLQLEKFVNGATADRPETAVAVNPGDLIRYRFELTNTGQVAFQFADVVLTDDRVEAIAFDAQSDANGDGLLSPGETWVYGATEVAEDLSRSLDFETDGAGNSLRAGDSIDDDFAQLGLSVSTPDNAFGAMIFDSANPTGGDWDLRTPSPIHPADHRADHGRGQNVGHWAETGLGNSAPQDHVLIISEDGDASDPDDNATGGTLRFAWQNPVRVSRIDLLDIDLDEQSVSVETFNQGSLSGAYQAANLGDNSYQSLLLNGELSDQLDVNLVHSGAVTGLSYVEIMASTATVSATVGDRVLTVEDLVYFTNFIAGEGVTSIAGEGVTSLLNQPLETVYDNTLENTLAFAGSDGWGQAIASDDPTPFLYETQNSYEANAVLLPGF